MDKNSEKILPTHDDPEQLANDFNTYFIEKVQKIRESIPKVESRSNYYARPFTGEKLTVFKPTDEEEIKKIIAAKGVKTCFEDPIPSKLMVSALDVIMPILIKLVNQSLSEGSMDGVNWSVLDPLLKKAGLDYDTKKNYRPVNNLLYFSKLTEWVVGNRLEHMDVNCLHEPIQLAYKERHNTEALMLNILKHFEDSTTIWQL